MNNENKKYVKEKKQKGAIYTFLYRRTGRWHLSFISVYNKKNKKIKNKDTQIYKLSSFLIPLILNLSNFYHHTQFPTLITKNFYTCVRGRIHTAPWQIDKLYFFTFETRCIYNKWALNPLLLNVNIVHTTSKLTNNYLAAREEHNARLRFY